MNVASFATRLARGALGALAIVVAIAAGTGWLYLLRHAGGLDVGPRLYDALPLQRLAGEGDQPLLRLVVAWVPAGAAAGVALALVTRLSRPARGVAAGVGAWVVLLLVGGVADAVTESDPLLSHLHSQFGHAALWVAALLVAAGALIPPGARRRRAEPRRAWPPVATRFEARVPWGP